MKKVLSILLSLCLIFTSISCVLTQSVSAEDIPTKVVFDENTILGTPVEDVSAFYNANNWYLISNDEVTAKCIFDASYRDDAHRTVATALTDGTGDKNGDKQALQISGHYNSQVYVPFAVKKNTNYRFSFYAKCYNGKSGNFANNSGIANSTFDKVGALSNGWKTTADGIHEYVTQTAGSSYQSLTGNMNEFTATPRVTPVVGADWVEISFTFNSQDNTDFYFFFRGSTSGSAYYFDEFQLLEDYYNPEDILFWGRYKYSASDATYNTIGGTPGYGTIKGVTGYPVSGDVAGSVGYNTKYTDVIHDTDDDTGCSMWSYGNNRHYTLTLPTLKPNTKYKLSFYHAMYNKGGSIATNQTMYHYIVNNTTTLTNTGTATTHFNPRPLVHTGKITIEAPFTNSMQKYTYEFETDGTNYNKPIFGMYTSYSYNYYDYFVLEEYVETNVSFNSNGGSEVETISGYAGTALTLPTEPTKAGYEFAGWYTDNETFANKFTATTFPAADVTLYAKWDKINPFMVDENWSIWNWSYAVGTGGTEITSANNVTYNTTIDKDSDGKSLKLTAQNAASAIKFDVEKYTYYTLTYSYYVDSDEHTGNSILSNSEIVKDGTLVGKTYQDGQFDFIDRNVSYRLDNGLCATNKDDVIDTTATRGTLTQTTTRTWHTVTHEFCSYDNTSLYLVIRSLQASKNPLYLDNFVLTKGDSYTPVTVTFETNGGDAIDAIDTKAGAELNLPEATKDGQKFAGWYTDETLTTAFDGVAKDSDFTLYADWADIVVAKTSNINVADYHLYELGSFGDEVTVSFEYRVVGGTASYYAYAPSGEIGYYNNDGVATVRKGVNGFDYKSNDFDSSTTNWQTGRFTHTIKLKNEYISTYTDETLTTLIDLDAEKLLSSVPKLRVTCGDGAVVYLKNIKFELTGKTGSLDAGFENRAAICAAENSKTGKNGLRVYNEVKTAWLEDHNIVEYGSIVTYKTLLGDTELTLDFANSVTGVAYSKADNKELTYTTTGNGKIHTSYLINVAPAYFAETVVIRNYAITADGKIFYDDEAFELCVFDVLNAMDNGNTADGSEPTQLDKDTFAYFVTDAVAADYVAWCEANKATTGALYAAIYA